MHIKTVSNLSKSDIISISKLVDECKMHDNTYIPYPLYDEEAVHITALDKDRIIAALCVCPTYKQTYEIIAFTHPSRRRKGVFSVLLDVATSYIEDIADKYCIEFVSDGHSQDAELTLEAIGAEPVAVEVMMYRDLNDLSGNSLTTHTHSAIYSIEGKGDCHYEIKYNSIGYIGEVRLIPYNKHSLYLCDYNIKYKYRGKKHGKKALASVLAYIKSLGCKTIKLQVSKQNAPAYNIYLNYDFLIETELTYWRL